jgi:E3 ubiquitin-protein ligase listerin
VLYPEVRIFHLLRQLHHLPVLFLHPNRRVRALAAGVQGSLLKIPDVREPLLSAITDTSSPDTVEQLLGTWSMAAQDAERLVSATARRTWADAFTLTTPAASTLGSKAVHLSASLSAALLAFAMQAILDPAHVYARLNPPPPAPDPPPLTKQPTKKGLPKPPPPPPARTSRADDEEESEDDRIARLRIGAMGVLQWILGTSALTNLVYHSMSLKSIIIRCCEHGQCG